MRVVHLPVYDDNAYQRLLMESQRHLGIETINGGGGGQFFRTALTRWKADILHFHWLHPYIIRPGKIATAWRSLRLMLEVRFLKMSGQRIVWTVHNLKNHDNRNVELDLRFGQRFSRVASALITHSTQSRKDAAEAFEIGNSSKIHVVPHGNYVGCYPNAASKGEARMKLGVRADSLVFLLFGRIQPYKGVLELIAEFKNLPKDYTLVIAGKVADSTIGAAIQKEMAGLPNILFRPGFVPDDQIQVFMNACDVVVFPYRDILTSGALVLAMSFGKACVAPNFGTFRENLDDRGGILYDSTMMGGLGVGLRQLASRRADCDSMGKHNFQLVKPSSWERVAAMTNEVYEKALRN